MIDKDQILFSLDKSYHISSSENFLCSVGTGVYIYDVNSGDLRCAFTDIKHPNCSRFTSNGMLIVKTAKGDYYIYDLHSMTLCKIISPPKNVLGSITNFQITSDDRYIIDFSYVFPKSELLIIDMATEEQTLFDLGSARTGFVFSTEEDSKYYVLTACAATENESEATLWECYVLTHIFGEFKLEKVFADTGKLANADYCLNKLAIADYSNTIRFFDIHKGCVKKLSYDKSGVLYDLKFSKNGKHIVLVESQNIYIYDVINQECVKMYSVDYGCFADFLDNTKLLIGTWEEGYCIKINLFGTQ